MRKDKLRDGMRVAARLILMSAALILSAVIFPPLPVHAEERPGNGIGPDAIWRPGGTVIRQIGQVCPEGGACFIDEMIKDGAPAPAVQFTRVLMAHDYPFCFMRSFQEMGKVGIAKIDCPFMANTMGYTLLVNGNPPIFALGDTRYLDGIDLTQAPRYASIVKKYPRVQIWPDGALVRVRRFSDRGLRIVWKHKLLNGCRACEYAGSATVAYDFDREGRYQGVKLLNVQEN